MPRLDENSWALVVVVVLGVPAAAAAAWSAATALDARLIFVQSAKSFNFLAARSREQ